MLQRLECILRERDLEIADLKTQRKQDRDHHSLVLQAQDDQILELRNKLLDLK